MARWWCGLHGQGSVSLPREVGGSRPGVLCDYWKVYRVNKEALDTHLKEHQAATRRGEIENSAIAEHAWSRHHQPLWEETRILHRASYTTILHIKEAIHISLRDPAELLNTDQGLDIDCCWKNLTRRPPKRQQNREQSRGVEPRPRRCLFVDMCRCAYYLAHSLSDFLSVYSDEGSDDSGWNVSKRFIVIIVGWNRGTLQGVLMSSMMFCIIADWILFIPVAITYIWIYWYCCRGLLLRREISGVHIFTPGEFLSLAWGTRSHGFYARTASALLATIALQQMDMVQVRLTRSSGDWASIQDHANQPSLGRPTFSSELPYVYTCVKYVMSK